jgi:hypothetical protein
VLVETEKLEVALDLALTALAQVAATGTNEEKVKAATALLQGVNLAYETSRKAAVASKVLPLLEAVTKNLSGQLGEDDPWAPAYTLEPLQQASLLMAFSKQLQ